MTKEEKIRAFNPNDLGDRSNTIYGLPFTLAESEVVVIPVPWEVTVSYSPGTAKGPRAVFDASFQVDLYDPSIPDLWKIGIAMDEIPKTLKLQSGRLRKKAERYISLLEKGRSPAKDRSMRAVQSEINAACAKMNAWVKQRALQHLDRNKVVALLGGDHSTPLGLMQALAEKHRSFGILQIDAHADLRNAYEGFEFSHASIMFNALKIPQVRKLVQVGIRDYCEEEVMLEKNSGGRVKTFYDRDIKHRQYSGTAWKDICADIIKELPDQVYLSFDIDGLDPKLCPNTGTPVAGGFEAEQVLYLVQQAVEAGKRIIAFDINEISPGRDEWDANVGARLLYRLAGLAARSNGRI
ncbi:MAG: agmatinase family protein [Bacteroidota bacterium]